MSRFRIQAKQKCPVYGDFFISELTSELIDFGGTCVPVQYKNQLLTCPFMLDEPFEPQAESVAPWHSEHTHSTAWHSCITCM